MSDRDPTGGGPGGFDPLAMDLPPVGSQPLGPGKQQVLAGRYRLGDTLSHGALGVVYEGVDQQSGRSVVIKLLQWWEDDVNALERFKREAESAQQLRHPNIVEVLDIRASDGVQYFVMEKLEGDDLAVLLKRERQLPRERVRVLITQLASAVSAVHAAGIVHRDVKPGNVIVVGFHGPNPLVKLIDFGVAKVLSGDQRLTGQRQILGGLGYMSPEQAVGKSSQVDARSDVYSVAALVYRMLVGKPPVDGSNLLEFADNVLETIPEAPSRLVSTSSPTLDAVLLKALSKQPDDRYATMLEFWQALGPALAS
jgi:serine/threonine protein kinase